MKFNFNIEGRNTYSYSEYRTLIDQVLEKSRTTGNNHSEAYINYTEMNVVRLNRVDKRGELNSELCELLNDLPPQKWILITEAWCGDAAQSLSWINKMAEINSNIDLNIILRDENLDIMDSFLTNNGRSIPKLIVVDENNEVLFDWGPRPEFIQVEYQKLREEGLAYDDISVVIHTMYAKDKGQTIQNEIQSLLLNQLQTH